MSKEKTAELNKAIKLKQKGYAICWVVAFPIDVIGFLYMMISINNTDFESNGNPEIALILAVCLVVSYVIGIPLILYADSKIKEIEFSED